MEALLCEYEPKYWDFDQTGQVARTARIAKRQLVMQLGLKLRERQLAKLANYFESTLNVL